MVGDRAEDGVQRPNPERIVCGDCDSLVGGMVRLENDMAAHLIDLNVAPVATETGAQIYALDVARELHGRASISSRTRRSRIRSGAGRSKGRAPSASFSFARKP